MKSNFDKIIKKTKFLVEDIRKKNGFLNFVQIGSHDCETFGDLPSEFILEKDLGHFVEPIPNVFERLVLNRKNYINCKFHNLAIVPEDNYYSDFFHVDLKGCQSSFIKGIYYDDVPESSDWEIIKVNTMSINHFIEESLSDIPDVYFISVQGYDNDIIKNILLKHRPNIFFVESWDMNNVNEIISSNRTNTPKNIKFTTRDEIIELLNNSGYQCMYETEKDRLLAWNESSFHGLQEIEENRNLQGNLENGKKYISYSLFGNDLKYYVGAERNIVINKRLLPDWETVIFYNPLSFRNEYLDKLLDLGAIMIDVSNITLGNRMSIEFPYFWRFIAFTYDSMVLSRDLDSRLSQREVDYIRKWENSSEDYFVIRDHPWHSPYPSGLFGIRKKIEDFETHLNNYISSTDLVWGTDQDILEKYMVNVPKENMLYFGYDKIETYIPRDNENFFIGMQLDEFDKPTRPSGEKCLEFLSELNLPTNFKKTYKYFVTTLAINEPYFDKSLEFYTELHDRTFDCYLNITTTQNDLERLPILTGLSADEFKIKYPKLKITTLEDFNFRIQFPLEMEGSGFIFNLNLKVLSIKACLNSNIDFDYLVYIDGDWGIHDEFSEQKFHNLFRTMDDNNIDFGFERPARIGDGRTNPNETFYAEKFYDYDCLNNPLWDEAHVVNEQFLVFRRNWKLILFEQKWEQMLWYTVANNIRNYPDGFEIGVSALEADMKWDFRLFPILNNCFYFYPKYSDKKHVRF